MTRPGSDLTAVLDDPAFYAGGPFPHYARLRTEAPMAWHPEPGFWVASRHAEVMAVSRDPDLFCSAKGILTFEIGVDYGTPPTMMHTDPPDHTRYRKLVSTGFRPSIIRAFEPVVRRRVRDRLDLIEPGAVVDFNELVGRQDYAVCEGVQQGVRSRYFTGGVLAGKDALLLDVADRYRREMGR